jgi:hypothetical protein
MSWLRQGKVMMKPRQGLQMDIELLTTGCGANSRLLYNTLPLCFGSPDQLRFPQMKT